MTLLLAAALAVAPCISLPAGTERITAAAVASVWPELAAAGEDAVLGFAPAPGVRRAFSGAELQRIAVRLRVEGAAPLSLCVERSTAPLDEGRLLEAMRTAMPEARIEIIDRFRAPVPLGEVRFPRQLLQASGLWKGYVVYGQSRRFSIWARVKVRTSATRVVAVERLVPGRAIAANQVKLETIDAVPGPDVAAHKVEDVVGRLPRRPVEAGAAVPRLGLADAPLILRGETVKVEVEQGGARLALEAKTESDGRLGDTVQITNPVSGKRFSARVTGRGVVTAGSKAKEHQ